MIYDGKLSKPNASERSQFLRYARDLLQTMHDDEPPPPVPTFPDGDAMSGEHIVFRLCQELVDTRRALDDAVTVGRLDANAILSPLDRAERMGVLERLSNLDFDDE